MDLNDIVQAAFRDELEKIAGLSRIGKPPMLPGTIKSKAAVGRAAKGLGKLFKTKISGLSPKLMVGTAVSGYALGRLAENKIKKMKDDYQMGRAVRAQG